MEPRCLTCLTQPQIAFRFQGSPLGPHPTESLASPVNTVEMEGKRLIKTRHCPPKLAPLLFPSFLQSTSNFTDHHHKTKQHNRETQWPPRPILFLTTLATPWAMVPAAATTVHIVTVPAARLRVRFHAPSISNHPPSPQGPPLFGQSVAGVY